jgi:hypothetical protein
VMTAVTAGSHGTLVLNGFSELLAERRIPSQSDTRVCLGKSQDPPR